MKSLKYFSMVVISLFLGCDDGVSPYSDAIKLLTNNSTKVWQTVSIERDEPQEGIDCSADDILTLTLFDPITDKEFFKLSEGFVRCYLDDSEYTTQTGSWRLNNSKTRIILTTGEGAAKVNDLYDILELSERKMILRQKSESFYDLHVTYTTITYESL